MIVDDNYALRIKNIIDRDGDLIFNYPNIRAMGLGSKKINGQDVNIPSLTFIVDKKIQSENIKDSEKIPKWINGVLTDVVDCNDIDKNNTINKLTVPPKSGDPAIGGSVISNEMDKGVGGIIAYAVTERGKKLGVYLLSAQHILAKDITQNESVNKGFKIHYPRLKVSLGDARSVIGLYSKGIKIKLGTPILSRNYNEVDAAIAWVGPNNENTKTKYLKVGIGLAEKTIVIKETTTVKVGDEIYFVDNDLGKKTFGEVEVVKAIVKINILNKETAFRDQIIVKSMYAYENECSGALGITLNENKAFGMLMCGEKGLIDPSYRIYYNSIDRVLDLLDIEFIMDK